MPDLPDFGVLYAMLFDTVTRAIGEMDKMNFGKAREMLSNATAQGMDACFSSGEYKDLREPYRTPGMIVELERRKRHRAEREEWEKQREKRETDMF